MAATATALKPNTTINWDSLKALYEQGASDVEVAREMGISMRDFAKMEKEIDTFARFVELGRTMSQAWWYSAGRRNLTNKEFQGSLYNFQMKNRFGWADKVETNSNPADEALNQDQLRAEINRVAKQLGKKHPAILRELIGETDESTDNS